MASFACLRQMLLILLSLAPLVFGRPRPDDAENTRPIHLPLPGITLKVLPIGDSITYGVGSTDGNGYRLSLKNILKKDGHEVNFIGTQQSGRNNPENYNEGYGAHRINEILTHLENNGILRQQPNLVLVHAGTNDNNLQINGETYNAAADRLGRLLDFVNCHDPSAVVLVAQLIGNKYNQSQTDSFNQQVPSIVSTRYRKGYKIRAVDMTSVRGELLSDLLHPNDNGYETMAKLWHSAILDVPTSWWSEPQPADSGTARDCLRASAVIAPDLMPSVLSSSASRLTITTASLLGGLLLMHHILT